MTDSILKVLRYSIKFKFIKFFYRLRFLHSVKLRKLNFYSIKRLIFLLFGLYLFTVPLSTFAMLSLLLSLSFLVSGILEIFFSIQNKCELKEWRWYLTGVIFNLLIDLGLVISPTIAAITLPLFIGFSLQFRSFQGLSFSFELRSYSLKTGAILPLPMH